MLLPWLPWLLLSAAFGWICWRVAGANLGLFIGGLGTATLLAPPAALAEESWSGRAQALAGVVLGVAAVWFIACHNLLTTAELLSCMGVLAAYGMALAGVAILVRIHAIVILLAAAWLTWPVWMATHVEGEDHEERVAQLMQPHPVFAINTAVKRAMPDHWHELKLMYSLVSIGQHVPATMPAGIAPSAALHLGIGLAAALTAAGLDRFRKDAADPAGPVAA